MLYKLYRILKTCFKCGILNKVSFFLSFLECNCKDWSSPFITHLKEVLNATCNDHNVRCEFFYNVFDHNYAEEKFIYVHSFSDIIDHLLAYKLNAFKIDDLISTLVQFDLCKVAVQRICKYIRENPDRIICSLV